MCLQLQYVYLLSLAADWSTSLTSCEVQSGEKATWTPGEGEMEGEREEGKTTVKETPVYLAQQLLAHTENEQCEVWCF